MKMIRKAETASKNDDDVKIDEIHLMETFNGLSPHYKFDEKQAKAAWKDFGKFKDWRYYWY